MIEPTETPAISITSKWLPEAAAGGMPYIFKLYPGERKVLRKRRQIPASRWAEKHRVVTMSSVPGRWKNETTPYLAGIMDASFYPSVQSVIVCAAPQTGKSEAVNNCIGYAIDRRPGSVLYVYPDEQTARENSKDRIQEMIRSSRRLRGYMTGYDDDTSFFRINLQHMQIYMGWARSAARLANKPLPYVVFDETDKYPVTAGKKEASPIALGEKRTRTFRTMRRIWKISTPSVEDGPIWLALTTDCDGWQTMVFDEDHYKFPADERDPERIEQLDLAWYECDACRSRWGDEDRNRAVRAGEWRSRDKHLALETYLESFKPRKIGFHLPSWLSYFVTLSEVAARFLKGTKNKTALKDFFNNDKAEPWRYFERPREESVILELRDERPRGIVPGGHRVAALTAAADTQKYGFWYEIRAWGWGPEQESWQVREGFVQTFQVLAGLFWEDVYEDTDGGRHLVRFAAIDAMGERTADVYNFCRQHKGRIVPLQGVDRLQAPHAWSNIEYYPGTQKKIPGGIKLFRVNVTHYKNDLSNRLEIAPGDPGAFHYHSGTTEEWARQMTAEYVDDSGLWQCPEGRANHAWDVSVYNLAVADMIGIQFWERPAQPEQKTPPPEEAQEKKKGNGWLPKRKDWLKR
jgi:phage terminase large subunit GpA-like protein